VANAGVRLASGGAGFIRDDAFYRPEGNGVIHDFGKKKGSNKIHKVKIASGNENSGMTGSRQKSWVGKMFAVLRNDG